MNRKNVVRNKRDYDSQREIDHCVAEKQEFIIAQRKRIMEAMEKQLDALQNIRKREEKFKAKDLSSQQSDFWYEVLN